MKKTIKLGLAAIAIGLCGAANAQTQITNGDFETWTYDGENLPNNWNSFQTAAGNYAKMAYSSSNRQVKKSTDVRPGSKGSSSCAIWARSVVGVVAQGNITTGRVNAGSMSAANEANYNFSDRDGSNTNNGVTNPCAMKFTGKPDSIVVWAKFVPAATVASYPYAKFSAIIHNDNDYIAYGLDANDTETNQGYVVGKAVKLIETNGGAWQRISLPFEYTNNGAEPAYIQLNASTNSYPGKGTKNDYLYIDDIECVYNTTYSEPLYVTVNGETTGPQTANVKVSEYSKTFNFSLTKFCLTTADGDVMPVGDIVINDLTKDADGNFSFTGDVMLQDNPELIAEYEYDMASLICQDEDGNPDPITLSLKGQFVDGKLYVSIDIDLTEKMGQVINVHLGYDRAAMSVTDAKYGTFCAPFAVTIPDGVTASTATLAGNTLDLTDLTTTIPACTPVILQSDAEVSTEFYGVSTTNDETCTNGCLTGVYADTQITSGYVLQNLADYGVGFYKVPSSMTVPANRAYIAKTGEAKALFFSDATAIQAIKALTSGDATEIYSANGTRQNKLQKGLNIMKMSDGKSVKVMVK